MARFRITVPMELRSNSDQTTSTIVDCTASDYVVETVLDGETYRAHLNSMEIMEWFVPA